MTSSRSILWHQISNLGTCFVDDGELFESKHKETLQGGQTQHNSFEWGTGIWA